MENQHCSAKRRGHQLRVILVSAWLLLLCNAIGVLWIVDNHISIPLHAGTILLAIAYTGVWVLLMYTYLLLALRR